MRPSFSQPNGLFFSIIVLMLVWSGGGDVSAQRSETKFEIGDRVIYKFGREKIEAEIIGRERNDIYRIRYKRRGKIRTGIRPGHLLEKTKPSSIQSPFESTPTPETREWSDNSGRFKVVAKMVFVDEKVVKLQKSDRRVVTVPIAKLSKADQEFIKKTKEEAENPFAGGTLADDADNEDSFSNPFPPTGFEDAFPDEDDFFGRPNRGSRRSRNRTDKSQGFNPQENGNALVGSLSAARPVVSTPEDWNYTPLAAVELSLFAPFGLNLHSSEHEFHSSMKGAAVSADGTKAAFSITNPFDKSSVTYVADLATGHQLFDLTIQSDNFQVLDVSNDGKSICIASDVFARPSGQLSVWREENGEASKTFSWKTDSHFRGVVNMAKFIDKDKLLSADGSGRIVLWDLATGEAEYQVTSSGHPIRNVALNADRSIVAFSDGNGISLLNVRAGEIAGRIKTDVPYTSLGFSHSGKMLAGSGPRFAVWDLSQQGKQLFSTQLISAGGSIDWVDDQFVLMGGSTVVDTRLRCTVWKYTLDHRSAIRHLGGKHFLFGGLKSGVSTIIPLKIPHFDINDQLASLNPKDLMVLKPRAEYSLDLDLPFSSSERREIQDKLVERFKKAGLKKTANSEIKIVGSVRNGKKVEQYYQDGRFSIRRFNRGKSYKVTYTPKTAELKLVVRGDTVWKRETTFKPADRIRVAPDQTVQSVAEKACEPKYEFFRDAVIPTRLSLLPGSKQFLGKSRITANGIQ